RNADGEMVSMGSVIWFEEMFGPQIIRLFNLYTAAGVTGSAATGVSSGQALNIKAGLAQTTFTETIGFYWDGVSLQESLAKGEVVWVFGLAVLIVYLVLAFLYESWVLPLAVILVVPLGLLGTVAAISLMGMDNNVYVQIGVVLIIG